MALEDEGRDNIFHERVNMLQEQGYRGFTLKNIKRKWDGVTVTVKNSEGRTLSDSGETPEEAGKKLIDKIDTLMD